MSQAATRTEWTAEVIDAVVRHWHTRLITEAPVTDLMADLANGVRLELPGQILRGTQEFRTWYERGQHAPLADHRLAHADCEVSISSPVHAQVTVRLPASADQAATRQEWWVVLQDEVPRIRTVVVVDEPAATTAPRSTEAVHT